MRSHRPYGTPLRPPASQHQQISSIAAAKAAPAAQAAAAAKAVAATTQQQQQQQQQPPRSSSRSSSSYQAAAAATKQQQQQQQLPSSSSINSSSSSSNSYQAAAAAPTADRHSITRSLASPCLALETSMHERSNSGCDSRLTLWQKNKHTWKNLFSPKAAGWTTGGLFLLTAVLLSLRHGCASYQPCFPHHKRSPRAPQTSCPLEPIAELIGVVSNASPSHQPCFPHTAATESKLYMFCFPSL